MDVSKVGKIQSLCGHRKKGGGLGMGNREGVREGEREKRLRSHGSIFRNNSDDISTSHSQGEISQLDVVLTE